MKNPKLLFVILLLLSLGCQTIVDVVIPEDPPRLVINSTLIPGEYINIHLSESQHILGISGHKRVEGAQVEVYEDGVLLETLPDSADGFYISGTHKVQEGKLYKFSASKGDFEQAEGEVEVPFDTVKILDIAVDTLDQNYFGEIQKDLRITIEIDDDGDMDNFYELAILFEYYEYEYDYSVNPAVKLDSTLTINPAFIRSQGGGFDESESELSILLNDELFNGKDHTFRALLNLDFHGRYDSSVLNYYVTVRNTSESYYLYEVSRRLQNETSGNPFAQPVLVYNNITNGFGIVGAYNGVTYLIE